MVKGKGARQAFANEPGGHRFQRIPPNERHGRRHTSTITVAVLGGVKTEPLKVSNSDLEIICCRGSGPGGQNRNKVNSAVQMLHKPSGLMVRCEVERSQHRNRELARSWLEARLADAATNKSASAENTERRKQVGTGQRGDKIRTVRYTDGVVTNNLNGKKTTLAKYLEGDFSQIL